MYVYIYTHTYYNFIIHSSIDEHSGCFHVLVMVNNATITWGCKYIFALMFLFALDKHTKVQLLNHTGVHFSFCEEPPSCLP